MHLRTSSEQRIVKKAINKIPRKLNLPNFPTWPHVWTFRVLTPNGAEAFEKEK